jgi:hypothetical protein
LDYIKNGWHDFHHFIPLEVKDVLQTYLGKYYQVFNFLVEEASVSHGALVTITDDRKKKGTPSQSFW